MRGFLLIIFFIITTSFVGANILVLLDRKGVFNFLEKMGLSYLFGIGAIALQMFFFWNLKIEPRIDYIILPWFALFIFNLVTYRKFKPKSRKKSIKPLGSKTIDNFLLSLISFEVVYTFFRALMKPVEAYDSTAIWSLKAKVLYLTRMLPANFFAFLGKTFHGIHPDYPLLVPFSEVWFYTFFNSFNDYLVKIIFPLNFLAFLLVFYSFAKRVTQNKTISLAVTFLLASVSQFNTYATIGMADLQMAIYTFITFALLYLWAIKRETPFFISALISCVFAFWTKNEGSIVLLLTAGFLMGLLFMNITRKKIEPYEFLYTISAVLILLAILTGWFVFKANMGLANEVINAETFTKLKPATVFGRIIPIAYEYQKQVFGFKKWNLAWIVFFILVIPKFRAIFSVKYIYIIGSFFGLLFAYSIVYLITPLDINWHLAKSASRLFIHILPLAVFSIAIIVNDIQNEKR